MSAKDNSRLFCKNCSEPLVDYNYCANCGQKSDTHVLTLAEFMEEIIDGLLNLDSRLWRTLLPLAIRPGLLTQEYLKGRRAHYLPPFRLYLVLSILVFLLGSFMGARPGMDFGDDPDLSGNRDLEREIADDIQRGLAENIGGDLAADSQAETVAGDAPTAPNAEENARAGNTFAEAIRERGNSPDTVNCGYSSLPADHWFNQTLKTTCETWVDDPDRLVNELYDSIPLMMLLGFPIVALFMRVLYLFSGQKFIEHVIFLFHIHAFVFLMILLANLSNYIGNRVDLLNLPLNIVSTLAMIWIPVYFYQSLRRVYHQGHAMTVFKTFLLLNWYFFCVVGIIVAGIVYVAFIAG